MRQNLYMFSISASLSFNPPFSRPFLRFMIFAGIIVSFILGHAQTADGILRGVVKDRETTKVLPNATVKLSNGREASTLIEGAFRFESLPFGRYTLTVTAGGYQPFELADVLISSHKEAVVEIALTPTLFEVEEVTLLPDRPRATPQNQTASVSALSFNIEETRKFAGGLDDPTRLAANFPGIVGAPFTSENFIAIRGNSPRGLIYRIEGIDIPNPNHFARIGSSGGTFTIFSQQVLANSDFFIGAFPAAYGNATSGVFDINFRKGNTEKREYTFQAGVLGFDLATEGPIKKGSKASYLVNYRLFSLTLAEYVSTFISNTNYQDLSFNIHLPTEKAGSFTLFGMGGLSTRTKPEEESNFTRDLDRFRNTIASDMGVLGLAHKKLIGSKALWRTTVAGTAAQLLDNRSYLEDTTDLTDLLQRDRREYTRVPLSATTSLKYVFSPRLNTTTGVIYTGTYHDYTAVDFDYIRDDFITLSDEQGWTHQFQAYAQFQYRASPSLTFNGGLHYLYFDLNQGQSLEPRLGMTLQLSPRTQLAAGYGLHSRAEDWGTYRTRLIETTPQTPTFPNQNLDLMRTHHGVLSFRTLIGNNTRLQTELYYQYLFDVPVEVGSAATFSVLNLDELSQLRILTNGGTGTNYGIDFGLERFSKNGFYYLLNASLFESNYTDVNGVQHSTAYDLGYKANILVGNEFQLGKKKSQNAILSLNSTFSIRGGQRYTPIDLEASRLAQRTILDESRPFELRDDPLYILDFSMNIYRNRKRITETWTLQIKNIFQSSPAEYREYDATFDRVTTLRGAGFLPVMSYKIQF
ncbi:MAG: TonB-dependent receptor [Bacteroidota bacterium]